MFWRYLLAVVLSLAIVFAYQQFMASRRLPPPPLPAPQEPLAGGEAPPARPAEVAGPARGRAAGSPERSAPGTGSLALALSWSDDRSSLASVALVPAGAEGKEGEAGKAGKAGPPRELLSSPPGLGLLAVAVSPGALARGAPEGPEAWAERVVRNWTEGGSGEPESAAEGRVWVHQAETEGLRLTRRVWLSGPLESPAGGAPGWHLRVRLRLENQGEKSLGCRYRLGGGGGLGRDSGIEERVRGVLAGGLELLMARPGEGGEPEVVRHAGEEVAPGGLREANALWVGSLNPLFFTGLFGSGGSTRRIEAAFGRPAGAGGSLRLEAGLESEEIHLEPGEVVQEEFGLYVGSRARQALAPYAAQHFAAVNIYRQVELSPRVTASVDAGEGALAEVRLVEYRESVGSADPYRLLFQPPGAPGTLALELTPAQAGESLDLPGAAWSLVPLGAAGDPRGGEPAGGTASGRPRGAVLETVVDGRLLIRKTIEPGNIAELPGPLPGGRKRQKLEEFGPPHLRISLELKNLSESETSGFIYRFHGPSAVDSENIRAPGYDVELGYGAHGAAGRVDAQVLGTSKLVDGRWQRSEKLAWVAVSNSYFTTIFCPRGGEDGKKAPFIDAGFAESFDDPSEAKFKNLRAGFTSRPVELAPGESLRQEYWLFLGPRDPEVLDLYRPLNFVGVNDYGMFSGLVKFFIWLLGTLQKVTLGSWGFAIILLTFLVKLCLHPINRRSQSSMMRFQKKYQKIQPQVKELQERYAKDKMQQHRELQKLFKEHGVSPGQQMAGCLILFLQLPIWFGLYTTLQYAIGLRQAGFVYIDDLTLPDRLFPLGLKLPLVGWEHFNLLPVLYVILTVINQRLQPRPTDPQMLTQYRMMTFMMVFFGFIFYSFPAGFMLYIMTSSALGIIESKLIKAALAREEEAGAAAEADARTLQAAYPLKVREPKETSSRGFDLRSRPKKRRPRRRV